MDLLQGFGIPAVDSALDWAWLFDIGQGDLKTARLAAESALAGETCFRTTLARAAVAQLQGDMGSALEFYERAFTLAASDQERGIAASLAYPCEYQAQFVGADGSGARLIPLAERYSGVSDWLARFGTTEQVTYEDRTPLVRKLLRERLVDAPIRFDILLSNAATALWRKPDYGRILESSYGLIGASWDSLRAQAVGLSGDIDGMAELFAGLPEKHGLEAGAHGTRMFGAYTQIQVARVSGAHVAQQLPEAFGRTRPSKPEVPAEIRAQVIAAARSCLESALSTLIQLHAPRGILSAVNTLGGLNLLDGRYEVAHGHFLHVLELAEQIEDYVQRDLAACGVAVSGALSKGSFAEVRRRGDDLGRLLAERGRIGVLSDLIDAIFDTAVRLSQESPEQGLRLVTLSASLEKHCALASRRYRHATLRAQIALELGAPADAITFLDEIEFDPSAFVEAQGIAAEARAAPLHRSLEVELLEGASRYLHCVLQCAIAAESMGSIVKVQRMARAFARASVREGEVGSTASHIEEVMGAMVDPAEATNVSFSDGERAMRKAAAASALELEAEARAAEMGIRLRQAAEAGDQGQAEHELAKGLREAQKNVSGAAFRRALLYAYARRFDDATTALADWTHEREQTFAAQLADLANEHARAMLRVRERWYFYDQLGRVYVMIEAFASAREAFAKADHFAQLTGRESVPAAELYLRAEVSAGLGDLTQACTIARNAVELLSARSTLHSDAPLTPEGTARDLVDTYGVCVRVLAHSGEACAAFELAERDRAENLLQVRRLRSESLASPSLRGAPLQQARIDALTAEAVTLVGSNNEHAKPNSGERDAALVLRERELASLPPERRLASVAALEGVEPLLSLVEVSESLPDGTLLVAYHQRWRELHAWAITRAGVVANWHEQRIAPRLFAALRRSANEENADGASASFPADMADELVRLCFGTALDAMRSAERVIFVPHGLIWRVPLHVLPLAGQPLIATRIVSYSFAASLVCKPERVDAVRGPTLVVGDPSNMSLVRPGSITVKTQKPLPGALLAAHAIAGLCGAVACWGPHASELAVRRQLAERPRIVHFGTHGFYSPVSPMSSGVLLADGDVLTVDEISEFDLRADLVVLSACVSARVRAHRGEPVGLLRALVATGARNVIGASWDIPDVSALLITTELQKRLLAGDDPAKALAGAQLRVRSMTGREAHDFVAALVGGATGATRELDAARLWCQASILADVGERGAALEASNAACDLYRTLGTTMPELAGTIVATDQASPSGDGKPNWERAIFADPRHWGGFLCVGPNRELGTRRTAEGRPAF